VSPARNSRRVKQVGIAGAAVGVVAAGLATAFAVERVLVRRSVNAPGDPYVDEPFGAGPAGVSTRRILISRKAAVVCHEASPKG